jgi:hypothetical protein
VKIANIKKGFSQTVVSLAKAFFYSNLITLAEARGYSKKL